LAQRARIVLLAADRESNTAIAAKVGVPRPTVIGWRNRYARQGVRGLDDDVRSGRPRSVDHPESLAVTLKPPPRKIQALDRTAPLLPMISPCRRR
jgi:transposase